MLHKVRYIFLMFVALFCFAGGNKIYARQNIVDYFLENPDAWNETKKLAHLTPLKVVVEDGIQGLGFELSEITPREEVALVFIDSKKSVRLHEKGFCDARDKLLPGKNRVVSVITRNAGNRTKFHYKFLLQRRINNVPISLYNKGNAVLESKYDSNLPVKDISNLSGIKMCEIEIE